MHLSHDAVRNNEVENGPLLIGNGVLKFVMGLVHFAFSSTYGEQGIEGDYPSFWSLFVAVCACIDLLTCICGFGKMIF